MQLPIGKLPYEQMLTKWSGILNPLIAKTITQGCQINSIALTANSPLAINHNLERSPLGWFVTDSTAASNIFRTQPFNSTNITLEANANTVISIWIY